MVNFVHFLLLFGHRIKGGGGGGVQRRVMSSNVACLFFLLDIIFHWTFLDITGHCYIKIFDFLSYLSSLMSNDSPECLISKIGYLHD